MGDGKWPFDGDCGRPHHLQMTGREDNEGVGNWSVAAGRPVTDEATPVGLNHDELAGDSSYGRALGARLRIVRKQRRHSLLAVQGLSGGEFKASVLGAYERGERTISVPRLQRLAILYDVPVDQLLPSGGGPAKGLAVGVHGPPARQDSREGAGSPSPGRAVVRVDLERLREARGAEAEALRHFLASIQVERQDFNGQVLTIRRDDVRVIGAVLGLRLDEAMQRLEQLGVLFSAEKGRGARGR